VTSPSHARIKVVAMRPALVRHALPVLALAVLGGCAESQPQALATPATAEDGAAAAPDTAAAAPASPPGAKHVISLRGSNTLGLAFAPKLVEAYLKANGATDIVIHDEALRTKQDLWISSTLGGESLWIEINTPGTKYGFESMVPGYADVVLASRPITDAEASKLAGKVGDLTAPASENVVAMDGIAVIVHPNNPVDHLTIGQLEKIYAGKVANWSELGGPDLAIEVLSRDQLSGTHDGFVSLVMNGTEVKAVRMFEDSDALSHTVASDPGAIGYVGLPYVGHTKALAIQDGGAQPLYPTPFTVATEDYALARRLFMYVPAAPKDPRARELVDFALSDAGQAVVGDAGFVPLSLRAESTQVTGNAPPPYRKLASGATRLSVNFRFRLASSDVDAKALHDLDRLTKFLASPMNRGRKLALAGFADAQGSENANLALSKQRADIIAKLLAQRGVAIEDVQSFGSALPVAPNDTPGGRARNRRVEAWLR
jgi:phosphate transport system substrate-binding protein